VKESRVLDKHTVSIAEGGVLFGMADEWGGQQKRLAIKPLTPPPRVEGKIRKRHKIRRRLVFLLINPNLCECCSGEDQSRFSKFQNLGDFLCSFAFLDQAGDLDFFRRKVAVP